MNCKLIAYCWWNICPSMQTAANQPTLFNSWLHLLASHFVPYLSFLRCRLYFWGRNHKFFLGYNFVYIKNVCNMIALTAASTRVWARISLRNKPLHVSHDISFEGLKNWMFWFSTNLLLWETADAVVQYGANAAIYKKKKIIWMHLQQQASCRHDHVKTDPLP